MSENFVCESNNRQVTLCEALDRVLNKGAVIAAELTISVADIDLIYLSLQALVSSVGAARKLFDEGIDEKGNQDE
jgi:hypothetical protein